MEVHHDMSDNDVTPVIEEEREAPVPAAPAVARGMKPEDKRFLMGLIAGLVGGALLMSVLFAVPAMFRHALGARRGFAAERSAQRGYMMGRGGDAYGYGRGFRRGDGQGFCPYREEGQAAPRGDMPRGWRFRSQPTSPTP